MYVKLNGEMVYLWRAVDHESEVLESYLTTTRDNAAALTFMKKALKRHGSPEAITTDGLRSCRAAMLRFRQMKTLQKFASVHANIHNHFSLERHLTDRQTYRERRAAALAEWQILVS